jgi:hypothetical protein
MTLEAINAKVALEDERKSAYDAAARQHALDELANKRRLVRTATCAGCEAPMAKPMRTFQPMVETRKAQNFFD